MKNRVVHLCSTQDDGVLLLDSYQLPRLSSTGLRDQVFRDSGGRTTLAGHRGPPISLARQS